MTGSKSYGLQSIDQKISNLLKPIFAGSKKEFVIINNLVKNWHEIIGKKYADFCYPKSINFDKSQKSAKLTIAVYNSSVGFYLENSSEFLLEKIATLYGYKAITKIIIKQEPKQLNNKIREEIKLPKEQQEKLNLQIKDVTDPDLADILEKLGKDILGNKNRG
jgi:hypothetical protein